MALRPGDEIEPLSVTPDRYLTVRYAGASGDFNPIHIDEEFAQQVGLPGRILHGLYSMAQVARALTDAGGGPAVAAAAVGPVSRDGPARARTDGHRHGASRSRTGVAIVETTCTQNGKAIIRSAEAELAVRAR